jgi:hypothetical protein
MNNRNNNNYYQSTMSHQTRNSNMEMAQYPNSFNPTNNLINRQDFSNKRETLHNNLNENLLLKDVIEYKIHIDTIDRNVDIYQSPFKIKVPFGTAAIQNHAFIRRKFKNVKFLTLDSVMLPRTLAIDTTQSEDGIIYPAESQITLNLNSPAPIGDNQTLLTNHKYLMVKIQEITNDRILGTSTIFDRDTFVIIPDNQKGNGPDNVMWKPLQTSMIMYKDSALGNLYNLTLTILDEYGNELYLVDNSGATFTSEGTKLTTTVITKDSVNYNFNDYIKTVDTKATQYTNNVTQVLYNFSMGVVENELNTNPNF